ncbi:MAG: diaminopimelate epimerase [Myxococcota bacterium]
MHFWKYEGLGNDFIVVEANEPAPFQSRAVELCDRHTGVGADGILVLGDLLSETPRMSVWNADGTSAQMCGNGLRCAELHRRRQGGEGAGRWQTLAGPHLARLVGDAVEVQMVAPTFEPASIPIASGGELIDGTVEVEGEALVVTAVGMGNPHAVVFGDFDEADRRCLGPVLQRDPLFPEGVNVGFATPDGRERFILHVLERGAGWTQACGTGACAAVAAAVATGRAGAGQAVEVQLPGGTLVITAGTSSEPIAMRGPARLVFDGTLRT